MASTKDFKAFGQDIQKRLTELESRTANMLTKTTADGLYLGKTATAAAASKLTTNAGTATNPVYFANGVPVKTTYTLEKSVPADAKFTDTWRGIQDNLTSTSTTDSLSANQGKVLKDTLDTKLGTETVLLDINTFAKNNHVYRSSLDNALYKANERYTVTSDKVKNTSSLFDGYTDSYATIAAGNTGVVLLKSSTYNFGWNYPYGKLYLSYYYKMTLDPSKVSLRVYQNWSGHNVGWVNVGHPEVDTDKITLANGVMHWNLEIYGLEQIEVTFDNSEGTSLIGLQSLEFFCNRTNIHSLPVVTKWGGDTIQGTLTAKDGFIGNLTGNANSATYATQDSAKQNIANTYIKDISANGTTITITKGNNTTSTFSTQDTTYKAASSSNLGLVKVGSNITGAADGTISLTKANVTSALGYTPPTTNTEYGNFSGATASAAGKSGLVPAPTSGKTNQVLRSNGTWSDETVQTTITGNAGSATKLQTARNISITGDTTASAVSFNGTSNVELSTTLKDVTTAGTIGSSTNETLTANGTFTIPYVTKDAKGRVTGGGTRTMTMPAAQTSVSGNAGTATKLANARNITLTGDATATAVSFDGSKDVTISTSIATMAGATATAAGKKGLVPAPTTSDTAKYLKGDGTWGTPNQTSVTGNAGTATKLKTARTIALSGAVTGTATSFDGSANITIPTTSVDGAKVTGIVPKATADASGNNIVNTYAKKADVYTKSEVDSKVSGIYSYKGTVASYDKLPTTGVKTGDVYNIGTALDGKNYAAIVDSEGGITWDDIGGKVDLSSYVTKTVADSSYLGKTSTAANATKLATARTIALSGAVTGTATSFDGSSNITIPTTSVDGSKVSGVVDQSDSMTYGKGTSNNFRTVPFQDSSYDPATGKFRATYDNDFTYNPVSNTLKVGTISSANVVKNITLSNKTLTVTKGDATTSTITLPADPTSVSGNAGTATKLQTARKINLGSAAIATATAFDGSKDITIPVTGFKEAYLQWGGKNFAGSFGPIDAAMVDVLGANRFMFGKPAGVSIEYSRDGGNTWTDYGADNAKKASLFSIGSEIIIGKAGSKEATKDYQVRVIITTDKFGVYSSLNKFIIYGNTNGCSGSWVTIEAATKADNTTFKTFVNKASFEGRSGYNVYNTDGITTYGNNTSQYQILRFTFGCTGVSTQFSNQLSIRQIMAFGGVGWNTPSTMAKSGRVYSLDYNQNAYFPAGVIATSFTGLASKATADSEGNAINTTYLKKTDGAASASKLTTARTISLTGDTTGSVSFDGSANASIKTTLDNSGVTAGTYGPTAATTLSFGGSVNVPYAAFDSKGRATKAGHYAIKLPAAPTSVSGNAGTATKLATGRNISLTGDVTGTATAFDGSANASISATLANSGVTAGKYGPTAATTIAFGGSVNIPYTEFDAKGRAISATHYAIKFPSAPTTVSGNAGSATKLQTARYIDGVSFNGTADIANYGTCSTAAATKDKVVACTGFALKTGARIIVKFTITNTVTPTAAAPITLNVNGTGAKSIFYHGSATWSAGYLSANRLIEFVYDGTQYAVVGDWDTNNRYNNMTAATAAAAGKAGLVPAPAAGKHTAFLRGDGTWAVPENTTYPAATNSVLGLVKVGSNITNSSGTISLTKANVTSALGYTPPTTNTTYTKGDYDTLGLIKPSKSYTSAAKLTTAAASAATAPTIAAISTTAGRYYAVEQDVNGVPFVNVPWVNNTYTNMTAATASAAGKAGLVPAPAAGAQGKFLRGDGTWQTPANTNNAVTQTVKSDNVNYPIIAKGTNATATVTGGVNFAAAITLNPSTGTINATKFNGALDAANLTGVIDGGTL